MKSLYFCLLFALAYKSIAQSPVDLDSTIVLSPLDIVAPYEAKNSSPFSFQNIEFKTLENLNYGQEASFILSNTPSMTVYSDAGSYQGYSYFRMRGMDQTRINMTLDGVPLNEPEDQGVYFSNYPDFLNSVSNIQIQRGVGTSKNGNSSYAGSLQFSSPNLFEDQKLELGAGYGSYNSYRGYAEYNSGVSKNKGIYLRASHLHSDGYRDRTANTSQSIFYSAGYFKPKTQVKITGFAGNQRNELGWLGVPKDLIDKNPKTNVNSNEDDHFTQGLLQVQHAYLFSPNSEIRSAIYYNHLQGNYDFDLNNYLGQPSTDELLNYAVNSHFVGAFSNYTFNKKDFTLTGGIHANHYQRRHVGSSTTAGKLYSNTGYKNDLSAFIKLNYALSKLTLYADLQGRYTDFDYKGSTDFQKLSWSFLNPKIGINLLISANANAYYSISKSGREPTRTDLFGGEDNLETDENGDPLLYIIDPEKVVDQELGIRLNYPTAQFNINVYYMDFTDEIVLNGQFGPNGLALNSKVDNSYRAGLELNGNNRVANTVKITHALSFNKSQIKQNDTRFSPILTPAFTWCEEVEYQFSKLELAINGRYQSSAYIDFSNEDKIDGYLLLNARVAFHPIKALEVNLFLNNLTDKTYFNAGYLDYDGTGKYFAQARFNYYLSTSWTF